ncbi:hypothetical protein ABH935_007786 [Catenulispora sp. GAS73]|uniref:hypothetical protein n=1 Tax=Catenulispora sp. GAS73 TaxID=3156269 RepID=UPI003512DFDD
MTTTGAPAHQRLDLRKVEVDDVLDRVQATLALRLDTEGSVRKRRSIGFPSDRGTWVRVDCRGLDRPLDQGWGTEAASGITGLPMPAWHQGASWLDTERGVRWRADETDLIVGRPIGKPQAAQELPLSWWAALSSALNTLAAYKTYRRATPDLEPATGDRFGAAIAKVFPDVDTTITEWTTAHADFNWPNLTGPKFEVFDWEDFGAAPRGLDAATLWFGSLRIPEVADEVMERLQANLESRDGQVMRLWRCAEFLAWATDEEPEYTAVREVAARLARELAN